MREIVIELRGRELPIHYVEPAGTVYEPMWWIPAEAKFCPIRPLRDDERRRIDFACLHDLVERRREWRLALEARRA